MSPWEYLVLSAFLLFVITWDIELVPGLEPHHGNDEDEEKVGDPGQGPAPLYS